MSRSWPPLCSARNEAATSYQGSGLTKGGAVPVIVTSRMSDVTYFDKPGTMRRFLASLLFYLLVLAALAMLIVLAGVALGFVPVAESS